MPAVHKYPTARVAIRLRARALYGSVANLGTLAGVTRQALHQRIASACRWSNSHAWWCHVLILPDGFLAECTAEDVVDALRAVALPVDATDKDALMMRVHEADRLWSEARSNAGHWRVEHRSPNVSAEDHARLRAAVIDRVRKLAHLRKEVAALRKQLLAIDAKRKQVTP
tara:strand:+ start:745 stop:1254 length:510 start_codon:yes stop_codon:yes gene_type:complete